MINNELEFVMVGRTSPRCGYCEVLKQYLTENGYDFTYIDIEDPGVRDYFAREGLKTVPQFFHRGTRIGGYETTVVYLDGVKNGS